MRAHRCHGKNKINEARLFGLFLILGSCFPSIHKINTMLMKKLSWIFLVLIFTSVVCSAQDKKKSKKEKKAEQEDIILMAEPVEEVMIEEIRMDAEPTRA